MEIQRPKSRQPIPEKAKRVFRGILFDVYQWEQELYNGTRTKFEKLKRSDTVAIFPVLPNGKILLVEQEQPYKGVFISTAGGRVDEGEDILAAAKRELLEETGYEAKKFILWDAQQPVSKIEWAIYTFIAKGLKKIEEANPDAGEKIKPLIVGFDELINIAISKNFSEREVIIKFIEAKCDPKKKEELRKLFSPEY